MRNKRNWRKILAVVCSIAIVGGMATYLLQSCESRDDNINTLEELQKQWPEGIPGQESMTIGGETYRYNSKNKTWELKESPWKDLNQKWEKIKNESDLNETPTMDTGLAMKVKTLENEIKAFQEQLYHQLENIKQSVPAIPSVDSNEKIWKEWEEWKNQTETFLENHQTILTELETGLHETEIISKEDETKRKEFLEWLEEVRLKLEKIETDVQELFDKEIWEEWQKEITDMKKETIDHSERAETIEKRLDEILNGLNQLKETIQNAVQELQNELGSHTQKRDDEEKQRDQDLTAWQNEGKQEHDRADSTLENLAEKTNSDIDLTSSEAEEEFISVSESLEEHNRESSEQQIKMGELLEQTIPRVQESIETGDLETRKKLSEELAETVARWEEEQEAMRQDRENTGVKAEELEQLRLEKRWSLQGNYWIQNGVSLFRAIGFSPFEYAMGLTDDSENGVSQTQAEQMEWMSGFDGYIRRKLESGISRSEYIQEMTDYGRNAGWTLAQYAASWKGERGDAGENGLSIGQVFSDEELAALKERVIEKYDIEESAFQELFAKPTQKSENVTQKCTVYRNLLSSETKTSYQMTDIYGSVVHAGCIHDTFWADGREDLNEVVNCSFEYSYYCGTADTPGCTNPSHKTETKTEDHTGYSSFTKHSGYPHTPQNLIYRGQCKCGVSIPNQTIRYLRTESKQITSTIETYEYYYYNPVTGRKVITTIADYYKGSIDVTVPRAYAEMDEITEIQTDKLKNAGFLDASSGRVKNVSASQDRWVYVGRADGQTWKWYE